MFMRNIAFLVIVIVTVAFAVSCNVQNSADKNGGEEVVSEKQETSSVEKTNIFTKIIEDKEDNENVLSRINNLETSLNNKIDNINLTVNNEEVINKLNQLNDIYVSGMNDVKSALKDSDKKTKNQLHQIFGAIFAAMAAILITLMLIYRYLRKFIAEKLIIHSHKNKSQQLTPEPKSGDTEENSIVASVNKSASLLATKVNEASFLFDAEKAVKLDSTQKSVLAEINEETAFLKKAGYEITVNYKYLIALENVNDKNYTEASSLLDEIKAEDETFAPAYFLAGYIAYVSRKYEAAITNLSKACELEPSNFAYLISYGNACLKEKKYEDAATALKKALEIYPEDASVWNNLAHAYIVSDNTDKAVGAFKKAVEIKPDFHEALHNLGLALGKLEKYEDAAEAFSKAIEVKSDKHESMYNAACVYALIGKRDGALSNLKKAIELNSDYAEKAKKDKDFESFKEDEEFLSIVK